MKNLLFSFFIVCTLMLSCRTEEESLQQIDQVIQLYIDSLGQDMLNDKLPGSYKNPQINDVYGLTDNAPITFTLKKDTDTLNYLEYVAGATRVKIDSSAAGKTYESKIAINFTKKINDSVNRTINDTMTIQYRSTPDIFQVWTVWYNGQIKFTKIEGAPNIVKISK